VAVAYPSLKSLGSWIRDLELRLDFIKVIRSWNMLGDGYRQMNGKHDSSESEL